MYQRGIRTPKDLRIKQAPSRQYADINRMWLSRCQDTSRNRPWRLTQMAHTQQSATPSEHYQDPTPEHEPTQTPPSRQPSRCPEDSRETCLPKHRDNALHSWPGVGSSRRQGLWEAMVTLWSRHHHVMFAQCKPISTIFRRSSRAGAGQAALVAAVSAFWPSDHWGSHANNPIHRMVCPPHQRIPTWTNLPAVPAAFFGAWMCSSIDVLIRVCMSKIDICKMFFFSTHSSTVWLLV